MRYNSVEKYLLDWPEGVSGGKGEAVAKAQLDADNKSKTAQLAKQNALQDEAVGSVRGDLSGQNGFSPELLAYLTSQFQNQNTGAFQSANSNVHAALAAHGSGNGDLPVGGDFSRSIAELEAAKASSQSQGNLGLGIQNLQQALNNKYNAANVFQGNTAQLGQNVGSFNSATSSDLGSYIQAKNAPGFGTAFAGALGKGLGNLATFGVGSAIGSLGGKG